MKKIQNILAGFLVSFIGSIPLGYLNLTGLEIYEQSGLVDLIFFLLGVLSIEIFVIYYTLIFAEQLIQNRKLIKFIDFFGILFMFFLAAIFFANINKKWNFYANANEYMMYSPFVFGMLLNCLNFLQIPFWTSWNLYLINTKYIIVERKLKFYYIAGTFIGVFLGMLSFIIIVQKVFQKNHQFSQIIPVLIPVFFIIMGGIQAIKVYKKYFKSNAYEI